MKHYSLKDKELLKRLNEIDRFFEQSLNEDARAGLDDDGMITNLHIGRDDLEITDIYDPEGWNDFPTVTPPGNTWMRCMRKNEHGKVVRYSGQYIMRGTVMKWVDEYGNTLREPECFRSWNDPWED